MRQQRRLRPEDTLTKSEAAKLAKVTPRTIQRWISQGLINKYTVKVNRVAISKRELQGLLTGRPS